MSYYPLLDHLGGLQHFEDLVAGYFRERARYSISLQGLIEGAPVGSLDVLSEDFMGMTSSSTSEFSKTDPRDSSENVETISQKSDDIDDDDDDDDDDTYMYEEDDTFVFDEESFLQAQFDEIANAPPGVEVSVSFKEEDKAMEDSIKAAKEKEEEEKALAKFISLRILIQL
ncbi:hypothetical protein GIB67_008157 [Kingdonia uniflora]|uniref:Uncharacterized protein n=1 Tax=Kingdonia uniflora TaxID=39325 RepID=A0A7J7NZH1_9MAGN|nr:hypothetical protein GIB67_008157 [Kingdonia uniflora]